MAISRAAIFMLSLLASCAAWSVNAETIKKYPNILIDDDHGILNEYDLSSYAENLKTPPFSEKSIANYNYWLCFPRDHISISLKDKGYSSEDIGSKENYGDLKITVWDDHKISYEYFTRRSLPVSGAEKIFNKWQKLMSRQKYVCLGARFGGVREVIRENGKHKIYSWTFDKLKTKKGCYSYFLHECYGNSS